MPALACLLTVLVVATAWGRREASTARTSIAVADTGAVRFVTRFVAFASVFSVATGLAGLIGWTFGVAVLTSVIPGQVIIKPNAAVALVLCGSSLWLLRNPNPHGTRNLGGRLLASAVALLGLASVSEHLIGWDLRIDQLLFTDPNPWTAFGVARPGLMSPMTALNFLLMGLALLWLDQAIVYRSRRYHPAQFLAFVVNTSAIVGVLDFVLGFHTEYAQVALQTAVALLILSIAVVCARPGKGLGALFVSRSYGGVITRRLWPATIIVPLLIGTASWKAYSAGWLSEWAGITLMIVAMITLLAVLTIWSGLGIDRSDAERRRAQASLHRSEEELREAQRLARVGSWWWDPKTDTVTWSEGLYRITGRDPALPPPPFRAHSEFYTPDSFAKLTAAVERAMQTGAPFGLELEMVRADGAIRSLTSRGEAERDADGRVVLVRGSVHDVTEHQRAEQALRDSEADLNKAQTIAHIGSWHLDVALDRLTWSDEVFRIFGIPGGTPLTYESFLRSIHPADRDLVERAWSAAMHGAAYDIEHRIIVGDAVKWVRERAEVEFDTDGRAVTGIGTVQDITERKRAQEELVRLNRDLRALSLCNQALIRATDESEWLAQVCRIIVDEAGYRFCWVGRAERDEMKRVTAVAEAGFNEGYLNTVDVTWMDTERGRGPTGTCIRTRRHQIVKNTATDPTFAPWKAEAMKRGYASIIAIPLIIDAETFGALSIYAAETDAFRDEEVKLLTELAGDLGFGVTTLRSRVEQRRAEEEVRQLNADLEHRVRARTADLEAAREREATIGFRIQQMLLLTQPPTDVPGVQVAALTIPSLRIDGDFYDFFKHQDQCFDVIVADVMGKGIPAALLAAATKSNFLEALCHLIAISRSGQMPEPKEIVTLAHADMVRQLIDLESFVTLSYARFDLMRWRLDLVDCGHTGTIVVRASDGTCEIVHGDNLPLGILEGEIFDQMSIAFEPGDLFLFYSDGITDLRNPAGEFYGADRLTEYVRINRELQPRALVDAIRADALAFAQSDRFGDDLTCVAVKIMQARPPLAHAEVEIRSDVQDLRRARAFVRDVCCRAPGAVLGDDEIASLELAVNEAASNIMKHAYHGRRDQRIRLDADAFPDRVVIRLHHLGDSFDPASVPAPALDGSRESGFGVYLITNSVDEVRYSRDDRGCNCIALVKTHSA